MQNLMSLFETYVMVLVHPFRIHQQFRYKLSLPGHEGHLYSPLTLAESLGISWIFAIVRGLGRVVVLNYFLQSFLNFENEEFHFLKEVIQSSGISTYNFLLFSAALDIIFFPIVTLAVTELWAWFIKTYSKWLNKELPSEEIADQITTHALSANLFTIIPFIGDMIQFLTYHFLLYAGLRSNLGASKSLTFVILLTPYLVMTVIFSCILFAVFYLFMTLS